MDESDINSFSSMLDTRVEHSNFGASIGSMFSENNEFCELLSVSDELTFMQGDKFDFSSVSST